MNYLESCLCSSEFWVTLLLVILISCVLYYLMTNCKMFESFASSYPIIGGLHPKLFNYSHIHKYTGETTNMVPAWYNRGCWYNMTV
jgi:hypothetical protein